MLAFPKQKRKIQDQVFFPYSYTSWHSVAETFAITSVKTNGGKKTKNKIPKKPPPTKQEEEKHNNKKPVDPITFLINTENMLTVISEELYSI